MAKLEQLAGASELWGAFVCAGLFMVMWAQVIGPADRSRRRSLLYAITFWSRDTRNRGYFDALHEISGKGGLVFIGVGAVLFLIWLSKPLWL